MSLCRMLESNIFGARGIFGMDASHVFLPCAGCYYLDTGCDWCGGVQGLHWMLGGVSSLFHGCHSFVGFGVCSPVVGLEALVVRFNKVPLHLGACSVPKDVSIEACEACVVTVNLCAVHASVVLPRSSRSCNSFSTAFIPDLV